MSKFTKSTTGESGTTPLDPSTMTEDQLRTYVNRLEHALSAVSTTNQKVVEKPWELDEKRWVNVPKTPTNDIITINGKPRYGRILVGREEWGTIQEMHGKAVNSELARMQTRGNMVPPHQLPIGDVSSTIQPRTIANLSE